MRDAIKTSLRNKIIAITVCISFIVSLVMTTVSAMLDYSRLSKTFNARINLEAKIISDNIGSALMFRDEEILFETILSFHSDQAIVNIEIYDSQNQKILESKPNIPRNELEKISRVNKNVIVDGDVIGRVTIFAKNHEIKAIISETRYAMGINLSISMVLIFILASILQKLISRPILELYKISQLVAKTQNYRYRVEVSSSDEVGKLAKMFNQMLEKVEQRDEKLEKLVEQRTFELEKLADEFRHRAFHDALTGLPNRALLIERFDLAVEHAIRSKNKFGCILLDLDNFKTINDTKGHNYGDQLLIEIASRLKETVRKEDLVCRLGGDEFVVLLIDLTSQSDLTRVLKKIQRTITKDIYIDNELVKTGGSLGASIYPDHGNSLNAIKRKADVAMYRAKDAGKNCFFIYTSDMQEDVKQRLMIQNDLETALKEDQLILYFQPKIHLETQRVHGCEVLIRWQHPKEGFLTPNAFIPYAEENQQIVHIDHYVINKCCDTLYRWSQEGRPTCCLAINLSGRHFKNFKIVKYLETQIKRYEIDPALLEIEITEAVLIDDPDVAQKVVGAIKGLGLKLSLDDFGTGYSSLNYIRTLPIDCVKLDHSFIQDINTNDQERRLIRGIMSLGKGLDLSIVAEGVETKEQLETLRNMNCDYGQGYYFLKPAPEDQFIRWLDNFHR